MGRAIFIGVLAALFAQILGFLLTGAGHGWMQAFYYSPFLFVVYPIVIIRWSVHEELPWGGLDVLLLALAILLDLQLIRTAEAEGIHYFLRVWASPPFVQLWLLLWLLWQGLTLALLARTIRRALSRRRETRGAREAH